MVSTLILTSNAFATTYYISASGSNSNNGTSTSTPFLTCGHLVGIAGDGDTILFNRGDTFTGACSVRGSNEIFDAYGTGARPLIDQQGTQSNCITSGDKTGVVLQNINCTGATGDGISFSLSGSATWNNIESYNNGVDCFKVRNTEAITYSNLVAHGCASATNADGFSLHDTSTATGTNYTGYSNGNGVSNELGTTWTCTSGCYLYGNLYSQARAAASGSGTATITINNSLIVGGTGTNIGVGDQSSGALGAYSLTNDIITGIPTGYYALSLVNTASTAVLNNVTIDSSDGGALIPSTSGSVIMKNVVMSNITTGQYFHFGGVGPVSQTTLSFCAFDKPLASLSDQTTQFNTNFGSQYDLIFSATPGYTSVTNGNYTLTSGSDLVNHGVVISGRSTDYSGNPIVQIPDIGAYEYQNTIVARFGK